MIKQRMVFDYLIKVFGPVSESSNPSEEGKGFDVANIFECEQVFDFLLDDFEDAGQQGTFLFENIHEFCVVG